MFQLRYTNSVYATSDTGELDGMGERVALMLQPRHTCSWVGDTPSLFINNFYHLDRAAATSTWSSFKSSPTTTTTPFETDEAMDDADAHLYTTTIIMHGEREEKTEDDDHNSLIGGTPAS